MAKHTHRGLLPPDDPIYTRGPVIGAKRFTPPPKTGKPASRLKAPPKATRAASTGASNDEKGKGNASE